MRVIAISGSLRSGSSNTAILQAVIERAPTVVEISIFDGIGRLPHFNPELESQENIADVHAWRERLNDSDAVIFCTPEYAHGIPGVLKNSLDWLVASGEFVDMPTAVISASPSIDGGDKANASLVQTLKAMMAIVSASTSLCIPAVSSKLDESGKLIDPTTRDSIDSLLDHLLRAVQGND